MTPQEMADQLDGREYPLRLSDQEKDFASVQGMVVVYGASDDLMEVEGAIQDEGDCYNGETFQIDKEGIIESWESAKDNIESEEGFQRYFRRKENAKQIEAIWDKDDISWQYKTDIPHATFKIMEEGEVYCIGIVFDIKELEAT